MDITPQIYTAKVMHKRIFPKENSFTYGVYYLALPLPAAAIPKGFAAFHAKDLGKRDGSEPEQWARELLQQYGLSEKTANIMLITMPRILGYVFNPVSFYFCTDAAGSLRAVIAEVHNTFVEQHCYLIAHPDHRALEKNDWLEADKLFHVSPFLERKGHYRFRFALEANSLGIWIDYFDAEKNKQLITALTGTLTPLTKSSLRRAFWAHPLVTLKTILLIHWQACKLIAKRIRYIPKPPQIHPNQSTTHNLTKW